MAESSEPRPDHPGGDLLSDVQALDSAHALFVRATYLVCHRLISSWKTDLNISLAALELLSGLARIHIKESDALECKRAVKWLCDYITYQCSRPPPAHSKDLHSTIVAAFHCCSVWLLDHPYLLRDKDCLMTVLEVAELGVSGSKSVGKPGEATKMKDEKELKPASLRVRDAAENLLTCILEQVGYFPSECGPESVSSLLDEISLLQHCNSWPTDCYDQVAAVERFRYFVSEGIILALLEEPLGNDQDPQPTVTILIRGPFGRHAWTMQLRHLPRHRSGTKYHAPNPGRPVAMQDNPVQAEVNQKYFPDGVERVLNCKIDQSIPSLESVLSNDSVAYEETNTISQLLQRQIGMEKNNANAQQIPGPAECTPPPVCHEFQTARLFLAQFGFLNFDDTAKDDPLNPSLIALDSSSKDFCKDLNSLDRLSPRTCDTAHIFYVRPGQTNAQEIVGNVTNEANIPLQFLEFVRSLGWSVDIATHPGWTGHISTSWRLRQRQLDIPPLAGLYDGQKNVLYWADANSEIAFVVPSLIKPTQLHNENLFSSGNIPSWYERSLSDNGDNRETKRALSLDLDKQPTPPRRSLNRQNIHNYSSTKIMIFWLENFEDHLTLPVADLLSYTDTGLDIGATRSSDVLLICLQWMSSCLLRVHLRGPTGRVGLASPLVDGMVVSRRALGPLVRHTALNMSRRRRLDLENYQPPHVKRKFKVQEIVQKYKREMTQPELYTFLFTNC